MPGQLNPLVLAAQNGPWSQTRTGTIVAATESGVIILVGGTSFPAQVIDSYQPVEGDLVAVIRQDATWLVLGRITGQGPNEVCNPSFENDPPGVAPSEWEFADVSGVSGVTTATVAGAPAGTQAAQVLPLAPGSSESYLYSCPISVVPGQQWTLSAYVGGVYTNEAAAGADAALVALWFANDTNLYPTTSAADTVITTLADVAQLPPFAGISGTVTVPTGAAVMRVALRSTLTTDESLAWDFVTARLTSGNTSRDPGGLINYTAIVANTAGVTTTHTIGFTTPALTFVPGRAYKIECKGFVQSNTAGDTVRIRVLKTGLAGQGYIDSFDGIRVHNANNMTSFYLENIIRLPLTSAALTDDLNMTYVRSNGAGTVFIGATSANPAYIRVIDIGHADDYPNANVIA